jgi:hypothetical protein
MELCPPSGARIRPRSRLISVSADGMCRLASNIIGAADLEDYTVAMSKTELDSKCILAYYMWVAWWVANASPTGIVTRL